jgi:hypothetical protein
MNQTAANYALILIVLPSLALLIAGFIFYPSYTGLTRGKAYLALIASIVAAAMTTGIWLGRGGFRDQHDSSIEFVVSRLAFGAAIVFLTAFALRLWGRWVGDRATPEERQPGLAGVRAWFSASNVVVAVAIVLTTWLAFGVSPLLMAVLVAAALTAYPVLRMESAPARPASVADDLSAEREKIVAMLEAGKLTPDESAELLQALSETSRAQERRPLVLTAGQRLMLIGAALVAFGFFLPWFVINPGQEASRMMNRMKMSLGSSFVVGDFSMPSPQIKTESVSISGGDIQKGLGWMALLLAGAAALIPYIAARLDEATLRMIRILCLGLGSLIVLYLLTNNIRFVGIGLVIAVSGYILEIVGVVRESRVMRTGV